MLPTVTIAICKHWGSHNSLKNHCYLGSISWRPWRWLNKSRNI